MLGAVFILVYLALTAGIVMLVSGLFGFVPALAAAILLLALLAMLVKGGITRMQPGPAPRPTPEPPVGDG